MARYSVGTGVTTIADLAIAYFAKGSVFGPATVERKPWQSSVLVADDRITAPVTVRYKALIAD